MSTHPDYRALLEELVTYYDTIVSPFPSYEEQWHAFIERVEETLEAGE